MKRIPSAMFPVRAIAWAWTAILYVVSSIIPEFVG